jgi:hypothetical protein
MSKIGKDECKEKNLKKNSFPFIQGDRMDGCKEKKKDECISIHPFHLEMCLLLFQKKNALLPYIIHNTYMRQVLKGGTKLVTKMDCQEHLGSSIFLLL